MSANTLAADPVLHAKLVCSPSTLDYRTGQRVQAHPGTSAWMTGDRFGSVEKIFPRLGLVGVRMDKSNRLLRFHPASIQAC